MYNFYNPHPQGKLVEDCVKRAFTKATGKTYQEVSSELNAIKRSQGASSYSVNSVWREYVEKTLNGVKTSYPAEKGKKRMNGHTFCSMHPSGTYVLNMAGHLTCCVDGCIYDTWDCLDKCVYTSWKIESVSSDSIDILVEDDKSSCGSGPADEENMTPKGLYGDYVILAMASVTNTKVKRTKSGEPWISLDANTYPIVLERLLHNERYTHLRWETKRGSSKSTIWDESTGMTLILKNGNSAYIWCTNNGK